MCKRLFAVTRFSDSMGTLYCVLCDIFILFLFVFFLCTCMYVFYFIYLIYSQLSNNFCTIKLCSSISIFFFISIQHFPFENSHLHPTPFQSALSHTFLNV